VEDDEEPMSIRDNTVHPTCVIAQEDIIQIKDVGEGNYATVKVGEWTRPDRKKVPLTVCVQ
jgi:hypothetical protein